MSLLVHRYLPVMLHESPHRNSNHSILDIDRLIVAIEIPMHLEVSHPPLTILLDFHGRQQILFEIKIYLFLQINH